MNKLHYLFLLLAAAITFTSCSNDDGGGTNDDGGGTSQEGPNVNKNIVTDEPAVARLEFPRLKEGNNKVIVYRTTDNRTYDKDRVNYAVEWDCTRKSQRWACYQMHKGYDGSYSRVVNGYMNDTQNLSSDEYYSTDYIYRSGYEHGHICPNADRTYSYRANYQTFYMTNMQPQYHKFNGYTNKGSDQGEGLWVRMENWLRDITPSNTTDTLYVCKGGTIDDEENIIERLQGRLIVPRYFFVALLMKNSMGYKAIGLWFEQKENEWRDSEPLSNFAVTIDRLEELTGIDFFCNLPDDIENDRESTMAINTWALD